MSATATGDLPVPAAGLEFLGPYQGSGLERPSFLVRRADGSVVQLTPILHALARRVDGRSTVAEIAAAVGEEVGRPLPVDLASTVIRGTLHDLRLVSSADDIAGVDEPSRQAPVLGVGPKVAVVPERVVGALAARLAFLYRPWVWRPVVGAFLALSVWLFFVRGLGDQLLPVLTRPELLLALWATLFGSMAFHELGHATACRVGGGRPGRIGAGVYLMWLVFYNDLSDSYRLDRTGRLRTDLGGIYFNAVLTVVAVAVYAVTGTGFWLLAAGVQCILAAQQLVPFLRFDGYYVVCDVVGVPDLFGQLRRRRPLTRRARVVVTVWGVVTVAALVAAAAMTAWRGPSFVRSTWNAFELQALALGTALDRGDVVVGVLSVLGLVLLAAPVVGMAALLARVGRALRRSR